MQEPRQMDSLHDDELSFEPTPADLAWWARVRDEDEAWDRLHDELAADRLAEDRMSLGMLPPHVAEALINGSVIGHRP